MCERKGIPAASTDRSGGPLPSPDPALEAAVMPFSVGPRNCVGKALADRPHPPGSWVLGPLWGLTVTDLGRRWGLKRAL